MPTCEGMANARRLLASILVLVGVASAGTAAAATWPKHQPTAADQALAQRSVLTLGDFASGSGWAPAAAGGSGDGLHDPACQGPAFSDVGRVLTGSADSSFQATALQVWSSAEVMKTLAMARHDASVTTNAVVAPCLRAVLRKGLPANSRLVSVSRLAFPHVGDWSDAYRALVDVSVAGNSVQMQIDVVLVLHGRVEITLMQLAPHAISTAAKAGEERLVQRLAGASLAA
jgi:hypothetical protein